MRSERLTVILHQDLLLAHVLHVDGAVDDEVRRGAVVCHLALVALNLQSQACGTQTRAQLKAVKRRKSKAVRLKGGNLLFSSVIDLQLTAAAIFQQQPFMLW